MIVNKGWSKFWRKWSWLNLRPYPGIFLEEISPPPNTSHISYGFHIGKNKSESTFNLWVASEWILSWHFNCCYHLWCWWLFDRPVCFATSAYRQPLPQHDLPKLLEDIPLAVRVRMWYMHEGAPAHFSLAVRDVLNNTSHDQRIDRGGPTAWPPRSPDLNPLDFYPWRHLNTFLYAAPVDKEEALHHRTVDACQTIRNCPGIFARMRRSVMRRVETFTESHWGRFQHLL
jgi:hypothetical protein